MRVLLPILFRGELMAAGRQTTAEGLLRAQYDTFKVVTVLTATVKKLSELLTTASASVMQGRQTVVVCNLGSNEIWISGTDETSVTATSCFKKLAPDETWSMQIGPGCDPTFKCATGNTLMGVAQFG